MLRLKTRSQFQAVLAGEKIASTTHFVLHRCVFQAPSTRQPASVLDARKPGVGVTQVWIGAMVPKRWVKRAVSRNAIKRQIYNVSAEFETVLPVAAHLVRVRRAFDRKHFLSAESVLLKRAVRAELMHLFTMATGHPCTPSRPALA